MVASLLSVVFNYCSPHFSLNKFRVNNFFCKFFSAPYILPVNLMLSSVLLKVDEGRVLFVCNIAMKSIKRKFLGSRYFLTFLLCPL